jgi:hypothetical protein
MAQICDTRRELSIGVQFKKRQRASYFRSGYHCSCHCSRDLYPNGTTNNEESRPIFPQSRRKSDRLHFFRIMHVRWKSITRNNGKLISGQYNGRLRICNLRSRKARRHSQTIQSVISICVPAVRSKSVPFQSFCTIRRSLSASASRACAVGSHEPLRCGTTFLMVLAQFVLAPNSRHR